MDAAFGIAMLAIGFLILVALIVALVFFCLTLQQALSQCAPRNRQMEPGLAWLMFVPLFNLVWVFFIALKVPDSLRNEFRDRGMDDGSDYGRGIGLTWAGLIVGSIPFSMLGGFLWIFALVSFALRIGALVMFILFWLKIYQYSGRLSGGGFGDRRYDDRDFDDRRDRRDVGPGGNSPSDAYRQDERNRIQ